MGEEKTSKIAIATLIVMTIMVLIYAILDDNKCKKKLATSGTYKIHTPNIDPHPVDVAYVEKIVKDLKRRRRLNKSTAGVVLDSIKVGAIRGLIGGILLGSNTSILASTLTFGTVNGIMTGSKILLANKKFLDISDSSAY